MRCTPQEARVLALIARGYTSKEIARELVISPCTVKVHTRNLLSKNGCSNRLQLAMKFVTSSSPSEEFPNGSEALPA